MSAYNNWHKTAIIYEIYPASFTKDGLQGIACKLEYIKDLGADAIWLCPIFDSPFKDSGYDTSDYYKINDQFGSMSDFEYMIEKAHALGLKVILDIALNHTSNEHHWFKEACKSKESPYRNYYIFREGKEGGCPNNWISSKSLKPTWTYNQLTDDYYLHVYTKYQPDLNWRNEKLRRVLYDILEFWIHKNVDGFRLDVINKIAKPDSIETVESEKEYADYLYENHSDCHKFIKELRKEVFDKYPGVLMLGQTGGISVEQGIEFTKNDNRELHLFLQFDYMNIDTNNKTNLQKTIMKWQNIDKFGGWTTTFMGNHDSSRMVNHFATDDKQYRDIAAKMLCALQLFLKGTQIIYMGDELAMSNKKNSHIDEFVDIRSKDIYNAMIKEGIEEDKIIEELNDITRDNARRQMPWEKAQEMQKDDDSVLSFYKKIIQLRKSQETLVYGQTVSLFEEDKNIFGYQRMLDSTKITLLANMSGDELEFECSSYGDEIICNYDNSQCKVFRPFEVKIFKEQD